MGTSLAGRFMTGTRRVTVLGAATSAGTHHAGQERAPDAPTCSAGPTDPVGCAGGALAAVLEASRLIVHFDVDAVDSGDLPLANFPHYGTGVPLAVARQVLSVLFSAPALSAVVLTEVNPSYDPAGDSLDRYIEAVTGALITGLAGQDG
jgi:hypothetical protein